ncbi:MAG: HAD family hydrolase [Patescibacteria group bacterium]
MDIKAVAFDVGGVIGDVHLRHLILNIRKVFLKNADKSAKNIKALFKKTLKGNPDVEKLLESLPFNYQDWKKLIKPNQGIEKEILQDLSPSVDRFIISNINEFHWNVCLDKLPIRNYFQECNCILSCRVGALKPEKEMWQKSLFFINRRPEEVLLIDNNPANVKSFIAFGGNAIRYCCRWDCVGELKRKLSYYGVVVT